MTTVTPPFKTHVLEPEEAELLASMVGEQVALNLALDEQHPNLDAIWEQMTLVLRTHGHAERAMLKLRPIIGKFLIMAKNNPEVYRNKGFRNYSDFINLYVCGEMGLSRAALYEVRMVADKLPALTGEQYVELGVTKASTLAKFCHSDDSEYADYLMEAQTRSATDFIAWATEKNLIGEGTATPATVVIQTDVATRGLWDSLCSRPETHSWVGSSSPGVIFKSAVQEALSTWIGARETLT